jgi:hypothetical protein
MDRVETSRTRRLVMLGALGGVAGSVVMAMYAMVVSAADKEVGFFTPLYHIGSAFLSPQAMMRSMEAAAAGDSFTFEAGPAAVGLMVHMVTGALAGAVFGGLVSRIALKRAAVVAAGAVYGLLVLLGNAFIGLPIVAEVFGGGEPIADMPMMVGWGTFVVEHLIYGLALGAVVAAGVARPRDRDAARPAASSAR